MDREMAEYVHKLDETLVSKIRVKEEATDSEIQAALDSVFHTKKNGTENSQESEDNIETALNNTFPTVDSLERVPALYLSETRVELEDDFRQGLMTQLSQEEPFTEIVECLQDPSTPSEWIRLEGKFKLGNSLFKIHHPSKEDDQDIPCWCIVVPQGGEYRNRIIKEHHAVPYSGHPGVQSTTSAVRRHFW